MTALFALTAHAKERIRQRIGITGTDAQQAWITEMVTKATTRYPQGEKTVYRTETYEIVCDGLRVITVKPVNNVQSYVEDLGIAVAKEFRKLLIPQERLLRKAEIKVAELALNYLKARNPRTKELISGRLVEATDEKQRIVDELYALRKAARQYGVSVE